MVDLSFLLEEEKMKFKDPKMEKLFFNLIVARDDLQMGIWTSVTRAVRNLLTNDYCEHKNAFIAYVESKLEEKK
jgi:hypothetical protein